MEKSVSRCRDLSVRNRRRWRPEPVRDTSRCITSDGRRLGTGDLDAHRLVWPIDRAFEGVYEVLDPEKQLGSITLAPYIFKAMALIGVRRKAGSNMFRHQINTLGILLDYKFMDSVLLKASVIHDLFEDAPGMPGVSREEIVRIDEDGLAVYDLVMEVTIRIVDGIKEVKGAYLTRVMGSGSERARILKLADRISNIYSLGFVNDQAFVERYLEETRRFVLPHAKQVNADMFLELADLVDDRQQRLPGRQQ